MLVGPSGIGKDTAINFAQKLMKKYDTIPILGGVTIENIYHRMVNISAPACVYLPVGELTAFIGSRDYQSGIVQDLTDLMSGNESKDVSTKSDLVLTGKKIIYQPTLTMQCGSTEEWLHKAMPDGALEGGFLGRFLIMVEQMGRKQVPLAKYQVSTTEEADELYVSSRRWADGLDYIIERCKKLGEVVLLEEAVHVYTNWYYNRFRRFSKAVMPYANRSRDTVLRLAMLMGLTREHFGYVDEVDIQFGIDVLDEVGKRIDSVVLPPTVEAQCAQEISNALPMTDQEILKTFSRKYTTKLLTQGMDLLKQRGDVKRSGQSWIRV